ncbi:ferredoxin [Nocardia noduli]|uniref:ferredoxin n=1 Tax=Nocardia noduli TaxID=2815722 RepID=UPI001C21DA22|nr:ferredoxin [Nocardia noduli]
MHVEVDHNKCAGLGICEFLAEDVFEVGDNGLATIKPGELPQTDRDRLTQVVAQCPTAALRLQD